MEGLSFILNIVSNDEFFTIRIILLIIVALLIIYLVISHIKESKQKKIVDVQEEIDEPFNIFQSNVVVPDEVKENEMQKEEIKEDIKEEIKEEIKKPNEVVYGEKNEEEEPELIQLSDIPIPDELEYTQALWQNDFLELQNLTKELENTPKEHKVEMTAYEAEQEEKAIISYDELVHMNQNTIQEESDRDSKDEILVPEIDLDKTGLVDLKSLLGEDNKEESYTHEEAFLESLKELKESLV